MLKEDATSRSGNIALLGLVVLLAAFVAALNVESSNQLDATRAFVVDYRDADTGVEKLLVQGDGQFFGMLAQDPTLARPEALSLSDVEGQFAYRAMRPAFGWLGWALSAGQPDLVPWALVALTVVSVGLLYIGVEQLALRLGRDPRVAVLVIVLPGVLRVLGRTGPEIAAAGFACLAVVAALDGNERRAVAHLVAAVLLRETLVLVVAGLVLARCLRLRWAVVPPAVLAVWVGIVVLRVGALPGGGGRFSLGGLVEASSAWGPGDWLVVVPLPVLMVIASLRSPLALALVLPHLALMVVMGASTGVITSVVRIVLPLYALLLPFASPRVGETSAASSGRLAWAP